MLELSDSAECLAFVKAAYEISEKFDVPAVLRTCTRVAHSQSAVELSPRADIPLRDYVKDAQKRVAAPANAVKAHQVEAHARAGGVRRDDRPGTGRDGRSGRSASSPPARATSTSGARCS